MPPRMRSKRHTGDSAGNTIRMPISIIRIKQKQRKSLKKFSRHISRSCSKRSREAAMAEGMEAPPTERAAPEPAATEIMAVTVVLAVLEALEALADMGIQVARSLLPEPDGQRRMCGCRQQKIISVTTPMMRHSMCSQSFRTVTPAGII